LIAASSEELRDLEAAIKKIGKRAAAPIGKREFKETSFWPVDECDGDACSRHVDDRNGLCGGAAANNCRDPGFSSVWYDGEQ
jgi:hypothetical protein